MLNARTLREGTVGLFALLGLVLVGGVAIWLRGGSFGNQGYRIFVGFDDASGLQVGAPVRFRGVAVGKVSALNPSSNGIEAALDFASTQLKIPLDSVIQITRYGLIGEASIDITPSRKLSPEALTIDPTSQDCVQRQQIFCQGERFPGEAGTQLMSSLTQLSKVYSSPEFVGNLNSTARNAAIAAARIAKMSDEIAALSKTARYQIRGISRTTGAIANTADNATLLTQNLNRLVITNQGNVSQTIANANLLTQNLNRIVGSNQASLQQTIDNTAQLMGNLNQLVVANRTQVTATLQSVQSTGQEVQALSRRLSQSVTLVDETLATTNQKLKDFDTQQIAQNLQITLANAAETSQNLRDITKNLNDPALIVNIQKTLDSARATFENVQKITADVDQITGNPDFRNNFLKLVDGLGNLVSSTEQLQQEIYADRVLTATSHQLQYQIDVQQRLIALQAPLPGSSQTAKEAPQEDSGTSSPTENSQKKSSSLSP